MQMVRLDLDDFSLSSVLPDSFVIEQVAGDFVEVVISLQGINIYTAKLYESSGIATFYELRQIVEQNMIARGLSLAALSVTAAHGDVSEQITGKYIVFSRYRNTEEFSIDFLESHFLVNRSYYTMPRDRSATVPLFSTGEEELTLVYDCVFMRDDGLFTCRLHEAMHHAPNPYIYNISVSPLAVKVAAEREVGEDCGQLLSFSLSVGERSLDVFVVDGEPCAHFYFRNSYNAEESVFVFGASKFKTEIGRKEAISQHVTSFYDKTVSRKWEVETVPLSQEEALWFNEFLESDHVTAEVSTEMARQDILIADITSEISDSAKDLVTIKFSYRFSDNARWL